MNERTTELHFEPLYSRRRKVIDFWPLLTRYVKKHWKHCWATTLRSKGFEWLCRVVSCLSLIWCVCTLEWARNHWKNLANTIRLFEKERGGEDSFNCLTIKMVLKKKTKQIWSTLSSCALLMVYHQISWWQGIPIERVREWLDRKWAFNLWMILIQSRYLFEELRYFGSKCALPSLRMRFSFAEKVFRNVLAHKI